MSFSFHASCSKPRRPGTYSRGHPSTRQENQRASATAGDTQSHNALHTWRRRAEEEGCARPLGEPAMPPRPHAPRRRSLRAQGMHGRPPPRVFGARARGGCPSRTRRVPCIAAADAAACERFLTLTVAYGSFEQALIALKQSVTELRAGAFGWGRHDGRRVASGTQSLRRSNAASLRRCGTPRETRHAGAGGCRGRCCHRRDGGGGGGSPYEKNLEAATGTTGPPTPVTAGWPPHHLQHGCVHR